jgi:hypothetical protein
MPVYLTLKAEGKIHLFSPQLYEAWFKEHPEHRALGLPLPNARDGRALTQDELANLAAAIQAKKAVCDVSVPDASRLIKFVFGRGWTIIFVITVRRSATRPQPRLCAISPTG